MIIYFLRICSLLLLFRLLLGYEFRQDKRYIAVGIFLIAVVGLLRIIYFGDLPSVLLELLFPMIRIVIPALLFHGRMINLLLFSVFLRVYSSCSYSTWMGIAVLVYQKESDSLFGIPLPVLNQLGGALLLLLLVLIFRKRRADIQQEVRQIKPWMILGLIVALLCIDREFMVFSDETDSALQILAGKSQILVGVIGAAFILFFVMNQIVIAQRRQMMEMIAYNERCIETQTEQYTLLNRKNEDLKAFRHDYRAHLRTISSYLEEGRYADASGYISQIDDLQTALETFSTGNIICDAILNQYQEAGNRDGVVLSFQGWFPDRIRIKETDLCILLSNAISNAYEAAAACDGERKVSLTVSNNEDLLFIRILNTSKPVAFDKFDKQEPLTTTKAEPAEHGFGMKNMLDAVKRNNGSITWEYRNGEVLTGIRLKSGSPM